MELLRGEDGCPWDREQTHESIRRNLIEETYEVIEALDNKDAVLLKEELGDLLLQVIFHSQISKDSGGFDIDGVIHQLCHKLIIRHPHVFGDEKAGTGSEVLDIWNAVKVKTKNQKTITETLRSVSPALPALMRADKLGSRCAKINYDFYSPQDALDKVAEETEEIRELIESPSPGSPTRLEEEIGDLLLAVTSFARLVGVDSEQALYKANNKFIERFARVEKAALAAGIDLKAAENTTKEELWELSKSQDGGKTQKHP